MNKGTKEPHEHPQFIQINHEFRYYPKQFLGAGNYGHVYKAYSNKRNAYVAVKIANPTITTKREIEILKTLSSLVHPNIMGYYGDKEIDGKTYIFIQYCPQGTLEALIKKGLHQAEVLKLFRQIVEGMCYMNAKKKMHRDFKPQNVLIGMQRDIKICDFGLGKQTNNIFVTGQLGTPIYAAPEVYLRSQDQQNYTYNCDVWSVGLVLFEMLTGKRLFSHVQKSYHLKQEWLAYERGHKQVHLSAQYHPLWTYFLNWMVQFNAKKRPTFHEVLQKIKKVYDTMLKQLKSESHMQKSTEYIKIQKYIDFQIQKHQILINLCEMFTKQDFSIRNQFKYLVMFLALTYYLKFTKEFINKLKYKKLTYNSEELIKNQEDTLIQILIDKNQLYLQQKYQFYQLQLQNNIRVKILNDYCQRKDHHKDKDTIHILYNLASIVKLVKKHEKGQYIESQDIFQQFKECIKIIDKFHHKEIPKFSLEELKMYSLLLICSYLQKTFPEHMFTENKCIQAFFLQFDSITKQNLIKYNRELSDRIINE